MVQVNNDEAPLVPMARVKTGTLCCHCPSCTTGQVRFNLGINRPLKIKFDYKSSTFDLLSMLKNLKNDENSSPSSFGPHAGSPEPDSC